MLLVPSLFEHIELYKTHSNASKIPQAELWINKFDK